jgi:hypothetical protein
MNWLVNTPILTKERGFLLQIKRSQGTIVRINQCSWREVDRDER